MRWLRDLMRLSNASKARRDGLGQASTFIIEPSAFVASTNRLPRCCEMTFLSSTSMRCFHRGGMHRMGEQKAKVCEFEPFADALRRHSLELDELWDLRISELDPLRTQEVAESIWGIIADLQVSRSKTQIVAGSKTLHHVLPDLVPPIDRQYTFRFFTGRKYVRNDKASFLEWYPHFVEIAHRARGQIIKAIERGGFMATGEAKILDNAIIAFMKAHGGIAEQSRRQ